MGCRQHGLQLMCDLSFMDHQQQTLKWAAASVFGLMFDLCSEEFSGFSSSHFKTTSLHCCSQNQHFFKNFFTAPLKQSEQLLWAPLNSSELPFSCVAHRRIRAEQGAAAILWWWLNPQWKRWVKISTCRCQCSSSSGLLSGEGGAEFGCCNRR